MALSVVLGGALPLFAQAPDEELGEASEASFPEEAGHGSVSFRLGYYEHQDGKGDGNPFLDEDLTVIEPIVVFDYNVTDRLAVTVQGSYDYVSSASIDRLNNFPEQSGATGDNYFGGQLGLRYKLTPSLRVGGHASYSTEYDYDSFGLGGWVAKDLNERNTTLKLSVNGFHDEVDIIRFNGLQVEGKDDRDTVTTTLSWYQVLTARTHSELGATLSYQSGFLETPYNFVVIEDPMGPPLSTGPPDFLDQPAQGTLVTEELPDSRVRGAAFGRIRTYFDTGTALELAGRLYADTWEVYSLTVEPRVYQWLVPKTLKLRVQYRFYIQTASEHFGDSFQLVTPRHRTQDSDLGDFYAHGVGAKFIWFVVDGVRFDVGGDYVMREDGIDQIFGSVGLTWDF